MTAFGTRDLASAQDGQQRAWGLDRLRWFGRPQITLALGDQRHRVLVAEAIAAATAGAASAAETGNGRPGDGAGTGGAGS
jgi:hypothetical protein